MRKPSSPLRRVLAVFLSLLILPWQQPALALAETPVGPVVLGLDVGRARDPLTALDRKLEALEAVIKSDEVKTPDPTATLPGDLTKIKADYKAAQDKYVEVEKVAPEESKPGLKPLLEPSTGQVLADALVETDLGGIRKDLTALLAQKATLSRAPGEVKDAAGWAAIEKAAPDFRAGLRPLSLRVEKARNQAPYAVKEVEEAYRPLADGLNATFQNLRGEASKLDIDGLLAAKPATLSGDAAGALMAEVAKAIGPEKAALLKPQLAAVNTKLAGYLRSGNQGDLTNALAEIDRLYDAANIKDKDRRAELYDRIGSAAQARAQVTATAGTAAAAESILTSNGVKKETDLQSMRRMDEMRLDLAGGAAKPDAGASALAAWWASGRAAAGPAWEALLKQLPGASTASDPAGYARDYALRVLAPALTADASPEALAERLGTAAGSWLERGKSLRAAAAEESRQAAAAEEARRAATADASRVARDRATRTAKEIGTQARAINFAAPASVKEKWTTLGPGRFENWAGGLGGRASSLAFEGLPEDKSGATADWDDAGTAVAAALTAQYEAISAEITGVIRDTNEADGAAGVDEAARYLRAVEALFGAGGVRDASGSWDRLEKFWTERGSMLAPAAVPAHERAARLVALLKALVAAQAPPTGLSKDLRNKMVGADGAIMPFGEAISAVQAAKLDKAKRMGAFLENLSATLKSGGTEAEMAAKLKAAFDGQKDLVGQGDDLATLASGLLAPPPAGDAPALAAFTRRAKTLQAAVEMMSTEAQGVDNSEVSLTRGFAQYNAFLYARLQDVAADTADGRALQEEPLKSLAAEFRRAYENSQGELSDVGGQAGQFSLAGKARAVVEKLPSLSAKRDAAQAQTDYLAALDRVGPERGKQLEDERQKTATALALFDGIMERAAKIRAQSERLKVLDDQVTNGQATLAQLNAAKDVLRGLYDGSGKSDTFAALCESAGVNASPETDFAAAKKALTTQLAAKDSEIAAYNKARGVLETALTGMVSQDGDGRAVTLDEVRKRAKRMGEWNLVREAREVMGTLAVYQTDDAARARLETDRRELRDVTLRRLYYGDYQPAATVKLREMAGRGELDAAQMVEAVSGIVDPRMVNRAFVERAKFLAAKKPGQLTSHDKDVLAAWTMYKAMLLEMAGQEEAGAGSSAAWAELLNDRDPAHWSDEALDDRKREFLTKVFETTPAKWRDRLAYLATPEGKASDMAKAYDAQAAKWKAAGNAPRAELYRRGATLADPAATLAALSAAVAEMKRRDPKWNGFTVLDDAWAKSLLAQTDPKAAVAAFADKLADGQRERLFDTTFRQDKDFTDKLVGRRLAEYVAGTKGVPLDVKAVASAFTRKEALEVAWEGLGESDRKTGEMLFGARAQLQSEVMRAWERNKLPEIHLTGVGRTDPDFSAFTNDKRITELRRLDRNLREDYFDAASGARKPANDNRFTGVVMGRNEDGVRTLTARSENGRDVINHVALLNTDGDPIYRATRTITDKPGGKPRLLESSTYTAKEGPTLTADDRTLLSRTIVESDRTVTLNYTDHSQFIANNDGTAVSYGLADGNNARVANRAVTELRKDAITGEYVVEARRYLRDVVNAEGKPTGAFSAAVYERPEGGGLWSVHTGAVGAVDSLRPKRGAKPESMYYTPPSGTLSPERIQSAAAATAKRVEALAPMGDKGQRITGLTTAFIAAQLTDSARLGIPGRAGLSVSFDVASKTMQSAYNVYGYDAKGKRIEERRTVQAVHKELVSEHDGKFWGIQFTDAQKLTGLVIFDGGQMKGIYVDDAKTGVRYMAAETERTRRSDDGALGFAGAVVFGEKHYEQVGFGNGAFKLAKVDVSPPPTITNGGYGVFGILTLAPVADKMAEWTEQAALYYGASPKAAKIWGAVVGAGFDIGLGIVTMGPGVVKLIQAAGKYGKALKIGLDVYFAIEGVKGAYESIHAMREAKDDAQFASALRGLIGSAVNVGMIAYMHAQTRPEAGRSREAGKEVEVPKGAPEPPPVEKGLKEFKEPTPEPKAPDTKAPDTKVPDTKVPDTKVPDTKVPDTKVPDTKVPDTRAPEIPGGEAPRLPATPGGEMIRPPLRAEAPRVDPGGMADKLTSGTRSSAGGGGDIAPGGTKAGANSGAGEAASASRGAGTAEAAKAPATSGEAAKAFVPEAPKAPPAAPKVEIAQRAAPPEPAKAAGVRSAVEPNAGMAEAAQRITPSAAAEPLAGARAGGMEGALPRGGEGPVIETGRSAKAPAESSVDPAVLEASREGAEAPPRPARPEVRREATRESAHEPANEPANETPHEARAEVAREAAREAAPERTAVERADAKPAADAARKIVEPSAQDAELLHQAEAQSLRPDPAPAARPAAKPSGGAFAVVEAKAFGGLDVVGRAFEGLAAKLHESNRPGGRAAVVATEGPSPSRAAKAVRAVIELPQKMISNMMAEIGDHLRRPANTAADAAEARFANFGARPEFIKLAGSVEPGAEVRVKVGVNPESGALAFGDKPATTVEVRARARADGTFELLDVGKPEGAGLSPRAAEHLEWVADRGLGMDGSYKGVVGAAFERMGRKPPSLIAEKGFAEAAAKLEGGAGLLEAGFDPRTGKLTFGETPAGAVKLTLEIRAGEGGPEVGGWAVKSEFARVEAAAAREIGNRLESSYRVGKLQAGFDSLVESRAGRAALAKAFDTITGGGTIEANYDPKSGRIRAGSSDTGINLKLGFGHDGNGALRLRTVDTPGRAGPLPAALEHNARLFAERRVIEPVQPWFRRTETAAQHDARLAKSRELAERRVKAEAVLRERALNDLVGKAEMDLAAARKVAGFDAPVHVELASTAERVVVAREAAAQARADIESAKAEMKGLSSETRAALPEMVRANRELRRAQAETLVAREAARVADETSRPAAVERVRKAVLRELKAGDDLAAAQRLGSSDRGMDILVRRENARGRLAAATAAEKTQTAELDRVMAGERRAGRDTSLSLAAGEFAGALKARQMGLEQLEYRRQGFAKAVGADGSNITRMRLRLELGLADESLVGRRNVGQAEGQQHCGLATAADMYATKTGKPVEGAMEFAEKAVRAKFADPAAADKFLRDTAVRGMNPAEIDFVMKAVAEAAGLKAVRLGAADSPFSRLAAGDTLGVVLSHADGGGHMVNLSNWRMAKNPVSGRSEAWVDVADPNTRVRVGNDLQGRGVYEAKTYSMRVDELTPQIRTRFDAEAPGTASYVFESAPGSPRAPPSERVELARRMGGEEGIGAGSPVAGTLKPAGFETGPGKVLDANYLPETIFSREIMEVAREHGLVYELGAATLGRMKPGVEHNYVIVENLNHTIEMTVGRLTAGNVQEVGVKHAALGDGRAVIFSGGVKIDPVTGRPVLDFNSGTYSEIGRDPRWAPTPENARSLAAHAEAILKTKVDVVDHFTGTRLLPAGEGIGAAPESPRSIVRTGATRGEGWTIDGKHAERLSGGGFKEVLIHPSEPTLVIKLFDQAGARDTAGSLSEKRLEMRNLEPLLAIGRAPRVVESGAVELQTPSTKGKMNAGYIVQERVNGRSLGDMLKDPDPAVQSRAMREARALVEDLIAARIKLEDRVNMHENISVGVSGKGKTEKAWVLDAGEATRVAAPGFMDKMMGRPDPLRVYYESVLGDLNRITRMASPVVAKGRAEGIGAAPDMGRYERYFSAAEIMAAHKAPESGGAYHDWQHTVKVADMAGEFAAKRGLSPADAKFVSEVALLHDFDARRNPGMPARVPDTLKDLRDDFAGRRSLNGEAGRSVLKERFGWTETQLKMAEAMIQRTEFPFGAKHPSPAYAEKGPLELYESMLRDPDLTPEQRAFVLREGALLSEYADKSSWYATEDFAGAYKTVQGLASEINRVTGKDAMSVENLGTNGFLSVIGEPASFAHDMALAKKLGVEIQLMNRAEAFKILPERYGKTFEANLEGFRAFDAAVKAKEADPFERGRVAAEAARGPKPAGEGIGSGRQAPADSFVLETVQVIENMISFPFKTKAPAVAPVAAPAASAASAYAELPASFRTSIEGYYRNTMIQASPRALAKAKATSGADPFWWFDHGPNHGRNVVENASALIKTAQERGIIEPRSGARAGTMDLMTRVNAGMHDIWMQDLTQAGRPLHPARAAREAFSHALETPANDILAMKVDGNRTLSEALVQEYGVAPADVPRVMREMMSMSYGHSKSAVPLEVLDSPSRMRQAMKDVVRAQEAGMETPYESHYEKGAYDRVAYDWLESNPKLSADMIDAVRILRPADAMRWRGPNDSRSSNGSGIGVAVIDGKVTTFMRMADDATGKTYMVRFQSPISMGEANTRYTAVNERGELTLGLDKGDFGSAANNRVMAEGSAHVILDVAQDWVGSFRGVQGKPIVVELPVERSPEFKKMVQDGLREALAELKKKGKDTRLAEMVVQDVVFVEPVAGMTRAAAPRAPPAELARYENGKTFDPGAGDGPGFLRQINENGVNVGHLDPARAFEGARVLTVAAGEQLIAKGSGGEFVYVLMDGGLKAVLGQGYSGHPLPAGVPVGEMAVISGNARSADVVATQTSRVMAIPKATYMAEWTKAFYSHDTILGRLKDDFAATPVAAEAPVPPRALAPERNLTPATEGIGAGRGEPMTPSEYEGLRQLVRGEGGLAQRFPPETHHFVGVGGSPAVVTAYLRALGGAATDVPLSVRNGFAESFAADSALRERVFKVLDARLPGKEALGGRKLVVIDYAHSGSSFDGIRAAFDAYAQARGREVEYVALRHPRNEPPSLRRVDGLTVLATTESLGSLFARGEFKDSFRGQPSWDPTATAAPGYTLEGLRNGVNPIALKWNGYRLKNFLAERVGREGTEPVRAAAKVTGAFESEGIGAARPKGVGATDEFFDGPPDAVRARQITDKASALRQIKVSLAARGKSEVFKQAQEIFYTDGLTGLPNRAFIMEQAELLLHGVKDPTVAMLDMNNFGAVNAGLAQVHGPVVGKAMGDGMLADAGPKIRGIAKKAGVNVARLGGEEIVVFGSMNDVIDFSAAMRKAFPPDKVLADAKLAPGSAERVAIGDAMTRMQRTGPVGDFTYGIAPIEGRGFEKALKAADGVLNDAKKQGLRGAAVVEAPGGVSFKRIADSASLTERVAMLAEPPPFAPRPERLQAIKNLKERLNDKEYAVFIEAAYKDPLTLTKTAEYLEMVKPEWEAKYGDGGATAMISARNFKAVNDVLGHAAGDLYLKRLGVIMRVEVNRLRKLGYSVEEPVRVGGKEFLLVGKDAAEVSRLVEKKFAEKLASGDVLPPEQMMQLRDGAVARGLIPAGRADHIGSLRSVSEPFTGGFDKSLERLILKLEGVKAVEDAPRAHEPERESIGAGFFGVFGGSPKSPAPVERIPWPIEKGGPEPAALDLGAVKLDGPLKNLEAAHQNVLAVDVGGKKAVLKLDAKPNEARVLAAMAEVKLPDNVKVPRLLGDAEVDVMAVHRLMGNAANVDYGAIKRSAAEGRHMIAVERLADEYVSMMSVTNGSAKLKAPISASDWQGLLTAVRDFSRRGMGFGDFGNETNIRVRQVPDGKGGVRTEFALIDVGQGTLKGNIDAINSDYIQLKGAQGLETRLLEKKLLEARGRMPDPAKAASARNEVPQARNFAAEMSEAMKSGGKPSLRIRAEGRRFTNIQEAAAFLNAPEGMHLLAKTSEGLAGDTVRVDIGGQDWYLKRVSKKLTDSADDGLRALSAEERSANEIGMREIVRRLFSGSFDVAPEAISIQHGAEIFVLTKGAAAAPDPARVGKLTLNQRVDWSILRLVFRAEDTNRGNILFNESAKPTLIDFEKVIAAPLDPVAFARGANDEIYAKGFRGVSLAGNDMAPYHARAEQLRARFADPAFVSELSAVLERSGWTPERTATYLKAIEINLKNFETNVQAYFNEVKKTSQRGQEGIGAGNEHAPALQLGMSAAAHFYEPYTWSTSGASRQRGIVGSHEEHIFRAALKDIGGKTTEEFPVPGFPGMTFVRYQLYEIKEGAMITDMRPRTYPKTIVDAKLWPQERLAEFGGSLYAEAMKQPDYVAGKKEYKVTRNGVEFILFVTDGQMTSFGAEAWDGKPAYVPPSRQAVPTAKTPIKRDP